MNIVFELIHVNVAAMRNCFISLHSKFKNTNLWKLKSAFRKWNDCGDDEDNNGNYENYDNDNNNNITFTMTIIILKIADTGPKEFFQSSRYAVILWQIHFSTWQ
jgi:hypothetical protein